MALAHTAEPYSWNLMLTHGASLYNKSQGYMLLVFLTHVHVFKDAFENIEKRLV